jgi:hypothetical protein
MPLDKMGENGQNWMIRDFNWHAKAKEMIKCYKGAIYNRDSDAV